MNTQAVAPSPLPTGKPQVVGAFVTGIIAAILWIAWLTPLGFRLFIDWTDVASNLKGYSSAAWGIVLGFAVLMITSVFLAARMLLMLADVQRDLNSRAIAHLRVARIIFAILVCGGVVFAFGYLDLAALTNNAFRSWGPAQKGASSWPLFGLVPLSLSALALRATRNAIRSIAPRSIPASSGGFSVVLPGIPTAVQSTAMPPPAEFSQPLAGFTIATALAIAGVFSNQFEIMQFGEMIRNFKNPGRMPSTFWGTPPSWYPPFLFYCGLSMGACGIYWLVFSVARLSARARWQIMSATFAILSFLSAILTSGAMFCWRLRGEFDPWNEHSYLGHFYSLPVPLVLAVYFTRRRTRDGAVIDA